MQSQRGPTITLNARSRVATPEENIKEVKAMEGLLISFTGSVMIFGLMLTWAFLR
jgi:hypothetical protein